MNQQCTSVVRLGPRLVLSLYVALGLLTPIGCGSGSGAAAASTQPTEQPDLNPAPENQKIVGLAEGRDDVGTNAAGTLSGGTVAIIDASGERALWQLIDFEPNEFQLATVGGTVPSEDLASSDLAAISDGSFVANPDDGDYLVCLLRGDGPYSLTGCGRMTVAGNARWTIAFGEGGVDIFAG